MAFRGTKRTNATAGGAHRIRVQEAAKIYAYANAYKYTRLSEEQHMFKVEASQERAEGQD